MANPTLASALTNANCPACYGLTQVQALKISILISILEGLNSMAATSLNSLLDYAKCLGCAGLSMAEMVELALLDQIRANISSGGGAAGAAHTVGVGSPEGAVVGSVGDIYFESGGDQFWYKKTGNATNTGWVALLT